MSVRHIDNNKYNNCNNIFILVFFLSYTHVDMHVNVVHWIVSYTSYYTVIIFIHCWQFVIHCLLIGRKARKKWSQKCEKPIVSCLTLYCSATFVGYIKGALTSTSSSFITNKLWLYFIKSFELRKRKWLSSYRLLKTT